MTESMVEKVARAMWNIRREEEDRCDMELEDMGEDHSVWAEARAALQAMREPTPGMLVAGGDGWVAEGDIYRAMIDEALKENAE